MDNNNWYNESSNKLNKCSIKSESENVIDKIGIFRIFKHKIDSVDYLKLSMKSKCKANYRYVL